MESNEEKNADDGVEVPVPPRRGAAPPPDPQARRRGIVIAVCSVGIAALLAVTFLFGIKNNAIYAKPVDELLANKSRFFGRPVNVDGTLVHGSLMKRENPCEYRFTIQRNGAELPVHFAQCVVPDTFRDVPDIDVGVTVQGQLTKDGTFEATQVLAKCPSKYEMQEKAKGGEKMPHAPLDGTSMR
jgi:cytochrome c-type biogenesis protein CcmE